MFELNLATLPNSILYLKGVQLSYIKVFVHIFNLWHSHKPCYINNDEFMKRTQLARSTIQEALAFFEAKGVFKRVIKGRKRYLVQTTAYLEVENETVDKLNDDSTKTGHGPEIADRRARDSRQQGPEIADHNNKYNNKYNKSFYKNDEQKKHKSVDNSKSREDWKEANQKKHSWAEKEKEPQRADVTKQSTSYDPSKHNAHLRGNPNAPGYQAFLAAHPQLKRTHEKRRKAAELSSRAQVQSENASRSLCDGQGATISAGWYETMPPRIRGSNGLLEACRVHPLPEEVGMANQVVP